MNETKPRPPIADELLDKTISLLEGPVNRAAERLLSSTLLLAPIALSMTLGLRAMAALRGLVANEDRSRP